ncbi:MAG: 3'-5' exonuclease, partial [Oscillospiraceae bacterium]
LENYFMRAGLPYRIVGGMRFFDRSEIKDVLAYMCIVENSADDLRLSRIINRPARKIGETTLALISEIASGLGVSMLEIIRDAGAYPSLARAKAPLSEFYAMYERMCESHESDSLHDFTDTLLDITGYRNMLIELRDEGATRLENVNELLSSIANFERENPQGDLSLFLEEVALISNVDRYDESADAVALMTLHSAKGLEFDCVFMVGMEEGVFPGEQSRHDEHEVEEERRLAYVGITRAKKKLYLTRANVRMIFGQTRRNPESRFICEFSDKLKKETGEVLRNPSYGAHANESGAQRGYRSANELANRLLDKDALPRVGRAPKVAKTAGSYAQGDRVEHRLFGAGEILTAKPLGGDTLLEIRFENGDVKKAMANYAPLRKL